MSDKLKKLTGKNPKDFEPIAFSLINDCDVELFSELVEKDDFLFDFVKQNVSDRLSKVCNESNYLNLIPFLKFYSPSYEEFIVSTLVRFADEDLTDKMLELFESGSDNEKAYCAKFFSYIQDPLAIDFLKQNAYSENVSLSTNCASTLAAIGETSSYNEALTKLCSGDDFEKLDAVRFLVSYGNKDAVSNIIEVLKVSPMAENMAGDLLYLSDWFELKNNNFSDALFVLNLVINGLGEILGLAQVFDFRLYDIVEALLSSDISSESAVVLLNAKDKFETLTENDEYLFDEQKDVKQEVYDIKALLASMSLDSLQNLADSELSDNSLFVYTALDLSSNVQKIRELLSSNNQTLVLKSLEVLKTRNSLTCEDKTLALNSVTDANIKSVIMAI
ncbi:hypothetical protein HDR58_05115 [bacterium]|nr:hypothetical protein [bacterium]